MTENANGWAVIFDVASTFVDMTPADPDLKDLLTRLKGEGFKLVIATGDAGPDETNKSLINAKKTLAATNLPEEEWPIVYTNIPKGFRTELASFAARIDIHSKRCILIDDSSENIKAAEQAGMHGIDFHARQHSHNHRYRIDGKRHVGPLVLLGDLISALSWENPGTVPTIAPENTLG